MTTRLIKEVIERTNKALIYYDASLREYCVKFFRDGVHQEKADYFTNDKQDAISTACVWTGADSEVKAWFGEGVNNDNEANL